MLSKVNVRHSAHLVGEKLMATLQMDTSRKAFFKTLSQNLQEYFHFDRLCINLYDQEGGMLTYFTAAEGTLVSTLSPVRPAEPSSTVAGHVISSRKPVVITDFAQYFSESTIHPIAEAGLSTTMAFPLILNNDIIATLHCSFAQKPDNIYEITNFLADLCPIVAICLGSILAREQVALREQLSPQFAPAVEEPFVYHSKVMRDIMRQIDAVARLDIPILLLGESGTGKTVMAHEIHKRSHRREGAFVKVNCPSLPGSLFESELFGHSKGAFTGAAAKRIGRVELAHKGTLFLDEIAELSLEMQSKLLQVLEESSFERVGESVSLAVDVRFVAATNVTVAEAVAAKRLRHDLFYRLSACVIEMPPLREHKEDIPTLVTAISRQISAKLGLPVLRLNKDLMVNLIEYEWPGNIRELRNVLTRLSVHATVNKSVDENILGHILQETDFQEQIRPVLLADSSSPDIFPPLPEQSYENQTELANQGFRVPVETLEEVERKYILHVLELTGGVIAGKTGAAAVLGLPRTTLQHRMRKLGISKSKGKYNSLNAQNEE